MSWYVLHVLTGSEDDVKKVAKKNGYKALAPKRKLKEKSGGVWKNVERILIPGYVFVDSEMTPNDYYLLSAISGVITILRGASDGPEVVPEDEMKVIFRLSQDDDLVGISDIYIEGEKIIVASGPLLGMEGNILKVDKRRFRAKIAFKIAGSEKVVELGINVLNKV